MKVKDLLDVQEVLEKRKTPCDMHNTELNMHFSKSKDRHINILDMDLIHLVRAYSKYIGEGTAFSYTDKELLEEKLKSMSKIIKSAKDLLSE